MKLKSTNWLWRWYQHYGDLGGRLRHPENLCRFVRVCFVWAPFRWFFWMRHYRDGRDRFAPFMFPLTGAIIAGVVGLLLIVINDDPWAIPWGVATTIQILSAIVLGLLIFCGGGEKVQNLIEMSESYHNAKSSGICPLIEVEYEEAARLKGAK